MVNWWGKCYSTEKLLNKIHREKHEVSEDKRMSVSLRCQDCESIKYIYIQISIPIYLSIYRDGESERKTVREGGKEGEGMWENKYKC